MKCREIIEILNRLAPESMACDWDNPGLLVGRRDKEVKRVLVAVDADDAVVEEALRLGLGRWVFWAAAGLIVLFAALLLRRIRALQ